MRIAIFIIFAGLAYFRVNLSLAASQLDVKTQSAQVISSKVLVEVTNDCHHYQLVIEEECSLYQGKSAILVNAIQKDVNNLCAKRKTQYFEIDLSKVKCQPDFLIFKIGTQTSNIRLSR